MQLASLPRRAVRRLSRQFTAARATALAVIATGTLLTYTLMASAFLASAGGAAELEPFAGDWVVESAAPAPWVAPDRRPAVDTRSLIGQSVRFDLGRVRSKSILGCHKASYRRRPVPPEGLFQGNLPAPATEAARHMGITHLPVDSLMVTCDRGLYDYHLTAPGQLRIAVDNAIWLLRQH